MSQDNKTGRNRKTVDCICTKQGCWGEADSGIPSYCHASQYRDELEGANKKYSDPRVGELYRAASIVSSKQDGMRTRIEEAIDFCKQLNFTKIGFAACLAFENEMGVLKELVSKHGLEPVVAGCQVGGTQAADRGYPELAKYDNSACNPIAQAEVLNLRETELNFIVGLCMGHDILFSMHSKAPVSTLIVKDRKTGNNPVAALHGYHLRKSLFGLKRWYKE